MFVKSAIENLIHEGAIGLVLTGVMILVFLGSLRATVAVFLSIPLSALAAFIALALGGSTVNTMILGGLALAFSRLIDNSVVVLENIFRHLELGEPPVVAAERGGQEVALPVLAATLTTVVVFFPGDLPLRRQPVPVFSALALSVVLSLFASYFVAMTVVPLFCANLIKGHRAADGNSAKPHATPSAKGLGRALQCLVQPQVPPDARPLRRRAESRLAAPAGHRARHHRASSSLSLALYPLIGKSYFPRTDPSQFRHQRQSPLRHAAGIDRPTGRPGGGHRPRGRAPKSDLKIIVSNIGITPGFSSILTPNSAPHTAFVQVGLNEGHRLSSFAYMDLVRARLQRELPQVSAYFQTGGLVDAILNQGMPAPLDIQVSGMDMHAAHDDRHQDCPDRCAPCPESATCWCRRTWIIRR